MPKTIREINEKIKNRQVVVATAEEIISLVEKKGVKKVSEEVDVVTTGTFGPMCSSGAFFNFGHSKPRIKAQKVWLNEVNAYAGLAAVDIYFGATEIPDTDPANQVFPGKFTYGGGHVIEDLVSGKDVKLKAIAYGTDCYPRRELETWINLSDFNEAILCNPRNCYQNYNCAVNLSERVIYTYMGVLQPNLGNANYCSAGQLSPLLKDPYYKTLGIGTRIFLGGGIGYIWWHGTQHAPTVKRSENGIPRQPAGTLAVSGDLKQMSPKWLKGTSFTGYGVTLTVGIGVPIPLLDEEITRHTAASDKEIFTQIVDYSSAYPQQKPGSLGEVSYEQLKSGEIIVQDKRVPTGALSSYAKAREIAELLKSWIKKGDFFLTEPVQLLPAVESGLTCKPLKERSIV